MNAALFGIPNMDIYLVTGILAFFIVLEIFTGHLHKSRRSANDWIQEFGAYLVLGLLTKPALVLLTLFLGNQLLPQFQYSLHDLSLWAALPLFLLVDDFLQYWYHRIAHGSPFLWKLHRPHHQAEEMGFFVSYRNAALYYFLMPNIWWIGVFTFLGGAKAVAIGIVLKQVVIVSSHSTLHWDAILYRHAFLLPIATVLERIFITPAFHHAHHGKSRLDGISDPNGNFGNMFSVWDQLFGTAMFTRRFPREYGLQNDPKEHWSAAYLYPIIASDNKKSEISRGFVREDRRAEAPCKVNLEKGKKYLWCRCGLSANQPYCDGSHHGTRFKPQLFEARFSRKVRLCACKKTSSPPYCDNSHKQTVDQDEL